MRNIILFFLFLIFFNTEAQTVVKTIDKSHVKDSIINNIYIPKDIEDCFIELSKSNYKEIKTLLLTISEDSIDSIDLNLEEPADFWMNWYFNEASRLTIYFNELGIIYPGNMYSIILHTFYRRLHNVPIRFDEEILKYKDIEYQEEEEYQKRLQIDSINGIYIPKDIKECFVELDKLLSKEDIKKIKELKNKTETIKYHHSIGLWIRNNWGLWSGSRFQIYMRERLNDEPDGMSAVILEYYWEWLNGININWEIFDKKIK